MSIGRAIIGALAGLGAGLAVGYYIYPTVVPPPEITDADCRALGMIKPEDCK